MNTKLLELAQAATRKYDRLGNEIPFAQPDLEEFANLIVGQCIDIIESYRIPVGNSPAGELAAEWTYDALKEIRDDIKETFGEAK